MSGRVVDHGARRFAAVADMTVTITDDGEPGLQRDAADTVFIWS